MKLQSEDRAMMLDVLVGVTSMASMVPIICSSRTLSEKLLREIMR